MSSAAAGCAKESWRAESLPFPVALWQFVKASPESSHGAGRCPMLLLELLEGGAVLQLRDKTSQIIKIEAHKRSGPLI